MWYIYVARFFSGAFLINALPHLLAGLMGRPFPSPFASPPGEGDSSPVVNVFWGLANLVVGYLLLFFVGQFHSNAGLELIVLLAGGVLMGVNLARHFGRVYADRSTCA